MTDFALSTLASPSQCHSINDPYSLSSTRYAYHKDKQARPGKLKKKIENRVSLQQKIISISKGSNGLS
jgi:hypothetical protein